MKIIIVEDEVLIREGIRNLLESQEENWEIMGEAESGLSGLDLIRLVKPDVVITDIRMPDMDGLQMLEKAKEENLSFRAIVLSAYSEFEYARTAIRLGVTEYLLKPISIDEFFEALRNIRIQIEREKQKQPDTLGSLEQVFGAVAYGQLNPDADIEDYLYRRYQIKPQDSLILVCLYLGKEFQKRVEMVRKTWNKLLGSYSDIEFCFLRAEYEQSLVVVIYHYENVREIKRRLQLRIMQDKIAEENMGFTEISGIGELKSGFEELYHSMDWGIALGNGVMVSYPEVEKVKTELCVYPLELENQMRTELCLGNLQQISYIVVKFQTYFFSQKVYMPKDIKESHVRFLWNALNIMKELDLLDYREVDQQVILDQIMNARSQNELIEITEKFFSHILARKEDDLQAEHLTVKRAKSMIHEYYQSGITLEEIAQKLDVTPEYLSSLFHRSVGQTFSSYMKKYRMGKAKELLIGTQMKLFEIAQAVGYADGKYFSKVFKECEGCLPAEYRRTHK